MERDMDLFRKILMKVEALPPSVNWFPLSLPGYPQEAVWYHAQLAYDKGLMHARFLPGTFEFAVQRLTADGHEFLELARDDPRGITRKRESRAQPAHSRLKDSRPCSVQ